MGENTNNVFIQEGDYEFSLYPRGFGNVSMYDVCYQNLHNILSPKGIGFFPTSETLDDGVNSGLKALLKHPRDKMVKMTMSDHECGPGQFYRGVDRNC